MSTLSQINDFARRSATLKLLGIALLGLLLLVPAYLVDDLIRERQNLRDDAVLEIGAQWGQAQRLAGPIIQVPYETSVVVDNKVVVQRGEAYLLPVTVGVDVTLVPETRKRSIYAAVLYEATVSVSGRFDSLAVSRLGVPESALDWSRASLTFGVEDVRGIDSLTVLTRSVGSARLSNRACLSQPCCTAVFRHQWPWVATGPGQTSRSNYAYAALRALASVRWPARRTST